MDECANYKLSVVIYADNFLDLEQLLCVVAEEVSNEQVTGNGGGCIGSFSFNVEESHVPDDP